MSQRASAKQGCVPCESSAAVRRLRHQEESVEVRGGCPSINRPRSKCACWLPDVGNQQCYREARVTTAVQCHACTFKAVASFSEPGVSVASSACTSSDACSTLMSSSGAASAFWSAGQREELQTLPPTSAASGHSRRRAAENPLAVLHFSTCLTTRCGKQASG